MNLHIGLDVGSTTAKMVALNEQDDIVFKSYRRHFSDVKNTTIQLLEELLHRFPNGNFKFTISGSSGMGLSEILNIQFIQEVIACTEVVKYLDSAVDVVIELGGEDAKIIYLTNGMEQRMNSACAGGTGAFIDQIASLLDTDAAGLNDLARTYEKIYPVASRCGVFAKTDIQPLLNEGARREDIAASVFQAVVNQTISGLACGRPIRGKVAFLGGPLTFLPELRNRFIETLKLADNEIFETENGQYFVAIGAAMESKDSSFIDLDELINTLRKINGVNRTAKTGRLQPLFANDQDLEQFRVRHQQAKVEQGKLDEYEGVCFLGIDAGSTTTKITLIDDQERVLFTYYVKNKGNPLESVREGLKRLYSSMPGVKIARSVVTGYGEKLIQAAFQLDNGEIETVAHYRAAKKFCPDVNLIIDIGGQDMKCIKIKDGAVERIMLNEACSAGCGSFIDNFASTLGLSVEDFADIALQAKAPVDLGSRCTVFMNSKVKEVQKEGAEIADISAGLSFSVIANALYKVIKVKRVEELGKHIVVQGGTFLNDAVLRAFEQTINREVLRPDLSGLMGAYGSALIAKDQYILANEQLPSKLVAKAELESFKVTASHSRCKLCENQCLLTINRFGAKQSFVTGNRCERGAGRKKVTNTLPNLVAEKRDKLFNRESLAASEAKRGTIGIPRVLNMYENYPFWYRFFTELGYRIVLSNPNNKEAFQKGMDTIASESVCYPAKIAHGHIIDLLEKGVDTIFFPSVVYEQQESKEQQNHFNCPVVVSYPESIYGNMAVLKEQGIRYLNPYITLDNKAALINELISTFNDISKADIKKAVAKANEEALEFTSWLRERGQEIIDEIAKTGNKGIVVAGHPYHLDPVVNHWIPEEIIKLGMAVLTEDAVAHLAEDTFVPNAVNQWTYHSRLYRAAHVVKANPNIELVQLTSFGCGLDAITTDSVQEILEHGQRLYTWIKIDDISNLGAARIRLRSLKAAMEERQRKQTPNWQPEPMKADERPVFDKAHKDQYTILAPQMAPTHFRLFEKAFQVHGYRLKLLEEVQEEHVEEGLKYVNNDVCYPAILTIGQILASLKSGEYNLERTAVIMSQTGGGCRATNYLVLLRKALKDAGLGHIPVLSLNAGSMEKQPGFKVGLGIAQKLVISACYGDLLMRLKLAVRPYERIKGSTEQLYELWMERCVESLGSFNMRKYREILKGIVDDFKNLSVIKEKKLRVGIVGEILVKYHPYANNHLIDIIEAEGGEAVVPDFIDFFLYGIHNRSFKANHLGKSKLQAGIGTVFKKYINYYRQPIIDVLKQSKRFEAPLPIEKIADKASHFISLGNQMGEGWLLTGEIVELLDMGVNNVVCVQPFACLPNHVIGRGMFNPIKEVYPDANLVSIDYDPGSSKVNQVNRIKLMMHIAKNQADSQAVSEIRKLKETDEKHKEEVACAR
ncbi:2-hydroxyglutaryl-CoA dehydratase [Desulfuribacillus alkaliarsenatis]|uniref:2-hydroxyglutaryl-CoA dehydratase n=1 Tax=Desulfuribacillus alkaliarsenatis TaxID=766136 RepID=A0A1E5G3Y0_9FIRM|nr:2-hydroxyacyl-CoA dehydratase [Desulfuribacillus alkaliarsenatis]OEF97785.1 2-hydroxyglutaryl-CoA dehydratase [Desulfuribacillus alkaliarsenatis]